MTLLNETFARVLISIFLVFQYSYSVQQLYQSMLGWISTADYNELNKVINQFSANVIFNTPELISTPEGSIKSPWNQKVYRPFHELLEGNTNQNVVNILVINWTHDKLTRTKYCTWGNFFLRRPGKKNKTKIVIQNMLKKYRKTKNLYYPICIVFPSATTILKMKTACSW